MQVARLPLLLSSLLALSGCPKQKPPEAEPTPERPPILPTLARDFAELGAESYPVIVTGPAEGALLSAVSRRHDIERYAREETRWGALPVLMFTDQDRPSSDVSAVAGWFLSAETVPRPSEASLLEPWVAPPPQRVRAVLLRDFDAAPRDEDPHALLFGLRARFPPPWSLCSPREGPSADTLIAYSQERGLKLALRPDEAGWTVDHVEYSPAAADLLGWWVERGYGICEPRGQLDEDGQLRPPRPKELRDTEARTGATP